MEGKDVIYFTIIGASPLFLVFCFLFFEEWMEIISRKNGEDEKKFIAFTPTQVEAFKFGASFPRFHS